MSDSFLGIGPGRAVATRVVGAHGGALGCSHG